LTITAEKLVQLRADTPACRNLIHFNNAGASLMPEPVFKATTQHLELERDMGGYEAAAVKHDALASLYVKFGELLRVQPEEIAFIENATRAWDMAFYALPLSEGDRIITHAAEYASSYLAFLQLARRRGVCIDIAPSDDSGQIDVDALPALLTPRTRVINLVHVPTQGGLVNPAEEVGRFAREHGLTYVLDACQSVGQLDVDVSRIGCHILSGTGRKFLRGPRGTGFLYVSSEILEDLDPPFIDMRAATWTGENTYELSTGSQRFENWESNVAGRVGLASAVEYALGIGLADIQERVFSLARYLRKALEDIDGITVSDLGKRQCGIVTFETAFESPAELVQRLRQKKVNLSTTEQASARLDLGRRDIAELARASVHYFNTESEIDRVCSLISR
jgi:cysteine desulfurase/selenocysteine lyase